MTTLVAGLHDTATAPLAARPSDGTAPRGGLLKWIGNKQRYASRIIATFPSQYGTYFEPFVGSGAVLATLAPRHGFASDIYAPLIEIWKTLRRNPNLLKSWYRERWEAMSHGDKQRTYEKIKQSFNRNPNGADLLFLCRSCYGGVVRFRKADGYMSTPCGIHNPMLPASFERRVDEWHKRLRGTHFKLQDYIETMRSAQRGDLVYCDPPYVHTQKILYGAQNFRFEELLEEIERCKKRGVYVALSIDGHKKSGGNVLSLPIPPRLFQNEQLLQGGASMLKRFQRRGFNLDDEHIADRLLLTY